MKTNEDQSPWGLILILFGAGILSAFQVGKVPPVLSDIRLDLVSQTGSEKRGLLDKEGIKYFPRKNHHPGSCFPR